MRRFAVIAGIMVAGLLLVALTLPWWLGFALARVGPAVGLSFGDYERIGFTRFRLEQVEVQRANTRVSVARVEAPNLFGWLFDRRSPVIAGTWRVQVERSKTPAVATTPRGWVPLQRQLTRIADQLTRWVPPLTAGEGAVIFPSGELTLSGESHWRDRTLVSPQVRFRALEAAVKLTLAEDGEFVGELRNAAHDGSAILRAQGGEITGRLTWWGQPASVAAIFADTGWRPLTAELHASEFSIPGERVKLAASYAEVRGHGRVEWRDGRLLADIAVNGVPREGQGAPPLEVRVQGHSEGDLFLVPQLRVVLPGVTAELAEPVAFERTGRLRSSATGFSVGADLGKLPWLTATGQVRGEGRIAPSESGYAEVSFQLAGAGLAWGAEKIAKAEVNGRFVWPALTIERGWFTEENGSMATLSGRWNFRERSLADGRINAQVRRAAIARVLPAGVEFETATVEGTFEGPLLDLRHAGRVEVVNARVDVTQPMAIAANWRGHGAALDDFSARASAGSAQLEAAGSLDAAGVTLAKLAWLDGGTLRLGLVAPARVTWRPDLQIAPLVLKGPEASLRVALQDAAQGSLEISASGFDSAWLRDWVTFPAGAWSLTELAVKANWLDGAAVYAGAGSGEINLGEDRSARIDLKFAGDGEGLKIEALDVAEGAQPIISVVGQLPLQVFPRRRPLHELVPDAPLVLTATTLPNAEFWAEITQLTGLEILGPEVDVRLTGTWNAPKGDARVRAGRIAATAGRFPWNWPRVEGLQLKLAADAGGVQLEEFSVAIEGQTVRARGALPVTPAQWREFSADPLTFARRGDLHVEIADAELAPLARYFPGLLAPQGRLQADVNFKSDQTIAGFVRVRDALSRPLGPLGVLQEINADIRFEERTVLLEGVSARMGGQVVTLQGNADVTTLNRPKLNLTLKGENLPFVRKTGLLLRGDLDLKCVTSPEDRTVISGLVRLRDSLFLSDLRALIPTGEKGTPARPPYFSIEAPPLNAWGLAVDIRGERFLRLRSPLFNGTASAKFRLEGTLGAPRILGEAVVDEGQVRLPFANFDLRQGEVRFTAEQSEPQLWVAGSTRRYGYDVRMELTGPVSAPALTFSSSPPLESEQVLLMVMAGQPPNNEITTTNRQRATRFGAFFGQSLLGTLKGDSGGADRLTISSGADISEQGRETYNIEYRLDERWSLTGEYDEFDDYYGGVKWRFYEKGGSQPDEKN